MSTIRSMSSLCTYHVTFDVDHLGGTFHKSVQPLVVLMNSLTAIATAVLQGLFVDRKSRGCNESKTTLIDNEHKRIVQFFNTRSVVRF